ncbi:hypothetical protein [Gordonia rubripertincta]|uniref:hypothetical protein n=1 Tax=Gordonia rubripertincta TaxID=36822 RepID=UPI000B8DAE8E|nr:hypothetical protein [Gordonia rubripertincta]ASR02102.1 hypothetical protein GCWB2_06430 [Gordonia rubripertincta]
MYEFPVDLAGDFSVVWSAQPGLDLNSRPGEVVRATAEAGTLMSVPGERNYPGAESAAEESWTTPGGYTFGGDPMNLTEKNGTIFIHLTDLTSTATTIHAIGCKFEFGVIAELDQPAAGGYLGGYAFAVDATRPPDAVDPRENLPRTTPAGTGDRAPRFDAFFPWSVAYRTIPQDDPRLESCLPKGTAIAKDHPAYSDYPFTEDTKSVSVIKPPRPELFPVLPQSPAWPPP